MALIKESFEKEMLEAWRVSLHRPTRRKEYVGSAIKDPHRS